MLSSLAIWDLLPSRVVLPGADLDGGVGLTVEFDRHIAADIVALAVVEVRPQGLALGLELINDLRLDLAQGLVGQNDAGLALNSSLDAGKEAVNIIGSGALLGTPPLT